jgi:hypothetical protein
MLVNFASLAFWSEPTARLILATFMISTMLMIGLYTWFGFARILGLSHVRWIPLLVLVLTRLPQAAGAFKIYLVVWCLTTLVSLMFDVVDVWKFLTARKQPNSHSSIGLSEHNSR